MTRKGTLSSPSSTFCELGKLSASGGSTPTLPMSAAATSSRLPLPCVVSLLSDIAFLRRHDPDQVRGVFLRSPFAALSVIGARRQSDHPQRIVVSHYMGGVGFTLPVDGLAQRRG